MNTSRRLTPTRGGYIPGLTTPVMERSIIVSENRKKLKNSLYWGIINTCLLAIVVYDVLHTSPIYIASILYIEYALTVIFFLNVMYYLYRYFTLSVKMECISVTPRQKQLLGVRDYDPNYSVNSQPPSTPTTFDTTPPSSLSNTPMNTTALSWRSNATSFNESENYMLSPLSFSCVRSTPQVSPTYDRRVPSISPPNMSHYDSSGADFISDEQSLADYLKGYETYQKTANNSKPVQQPNSLLTSFWSHPASKNGMDAALFVQKCQYQHSPLTSDPPEIFECPDPLQPLCHSNFPNNYYEQFPRPFMLCACQGSASNSPSGKSDHKTSPVNNQPLGVELWKRFHVGSTTLTKWNANIRMWLSQTIVERLVKEFEHIDDSLQKQGLSDVKIGGVGLDRLRKTSQMAPVLQFIPTLSTLIPFLEVTANQEYLVKRIRELGKGGCMSDFKWNGGSNFNGKDWDDSLPTDSAIIMHLFVTYMDTQLLPLPNKPDVKPFIGYHYVKCTDKMPILTPTSLAIHQFSEKPPHYRVIAGDEIFEMVKGYNNLFHTLLLFLYQVNRRELGMLGRINLGKSGINILWVIDS